MKTIFEQIEEIGVVPVIKIDDVEKAVPLAKALLAGGIPCAEVTFRTAQAEEGIRRMAAEVPEILVGAGTILTTEQVDKAVGAGAKFVVSAGLNPKIVEYCISRGVPIAPGCSSPSDIEKAMEFGLRVVKFFPAEQAGGLDFIKAVAAPYSMMKFMPTGGINAANIGKYLAFDKILACGGSWMVNADMISAGRFDEITELCKTAMRTVLGFEIRHIGAAGDSAKMLETMFGFAPGSDSGKIVIGVNSILRARAFLERQGFCFADGDTMVGEIAGLAVQLVKK